MCSSGTVRSGLGQEEPGESLCFHQVHRVGLGREKAREKASLSALRLMEVVHPTQYLT